jgi:hypothetical protein
LVGITVEVPGDVPCQGAIENVLEITTESTIEFPSEFAVEVTANSADDGECTKEGKVIGEIEGTTVSAGPGTVPHHETPPAMPGRSFATKALGV